MKLKITERRALTPDIDEFTFCSVDGEPLPAAEPGAHLSIETPSGAMRRYSLLHPSDAPKCYKVAIKREVNSRGGSRSMHERAQLGTEIFGAKVESEFPLGAKHDALLIAGGIGVTPIYAMAQRLKEEGRKFRVIYCTRGAEFTAYADELRALCGDNITIHHDGGDPDKVYDFWGLLAEPTAEHVYCCGPSPLMEEVKAVTGHWPEGRVHFEEFKPADITRDDDNTFVVSLAKTGIDVEVPANRSILEALRDAGHKFASSCESGTCGTCKSRYLEGEVDHRDMVLMDDEKTSKIMICISRAKGDRLVLDL